jgi:hypothetical protein
MRWAGHVARMGEKMHMQFWYKNLKEGELILDLDLYGRMILK